MAMDGNAAIDHNREVLKRIFVMLVAMAEFSVGADFVLPARGSAKTLPRHLHRAVLRILRRAEAAARRLIIAMACGLAVTVQPSRRFERKPKPASAPPVQPPARCALPLLDPLRQPFRRRRPISSSIPRICTPGWTEPFPIVVRQPPSRYDQVDATRLGRRLAALGRALEDMPREARRDRARQRNRPHRIWPIRPGCPPAARRANRHPEEIDDVVAHAHALAQWALERRDTS